MRAEQIEAIVSLGRATIHPNGDRAVVAASHPDLAADRNVGQLWEVMLDGSGSRRLTRGVADRAPVFSPDGRALAFLRGVDGAPQIHLAPAAGGEATVITDAKLGIESFVWSPDGARIAFVARNAEPGRYGTVEGLSADAEAPRRITTTRYSANGLGYTNDRREQLHLVDVPGLHEEPVYDPAPRADQGETPPEKPRKVPEARRVTTADADHWSPVFSPDGNSLYFIAALHDTSDSDLRTDLYRIELDGEGENTPECVTASSAPLDVIDFDIAPDGTIWLIAIELGESALDFVGRDGAVFRLDGSRLTRLTDPDTHHFADISEQIIALSSEAALAIDCTRGRAPLVRIDAAGEVTTVLGGDVDVAALDTVGTRILATLATPTSSGELALVEQGVSTRILTDFGAALRATELVTPVEEEHEGRDGYPVHGWVAVPSGEGPHPALLMIHGGPFTQYGVHVFDETQVYVDAGYAVVYCNPRGASGYGEAHGRAIRGRMGTVDLDDVLAFLEGALAAHPELDAARLGILGGSYGGYLTAWAIAHDHRFAAAVVERGYLDPEYFIGTSDIGSFFGTEYNGPTPEQRATQSPQAFVDRVVTPALIVHSEQDLRCPLPQAERYYAALKANGVDTELLIFPGENHELSRSGRPRHRVQRFEAILEWFGRYLPVHPAESASE